MAPDRWLVLTVRTDDASARGLLASVLVDLGGRAVEERDGALVTHLPPPEDPEAFAEGVRQRLRESAEGARLEWTWQPHEAWEETWKRGLAPRRVTDRVIVAPTWSTPEVGPDEVVIRVDPGVAFGTAEHATTRGALRILERCLGPSDHVVDVGCGTGILAIAAALLGAGRVTALEVDAYACETARENLSHNGVSDRVAVRERRATPGLFAEIGPADGIVANIDEATLTGLLPGFGRALGEAGWLVVSGIEEDCTATFVRRARAEGFEPGDALVEDGWWSGSFTWIGRSDAAAPAPHGEGASTGRGSRRSRRRSSD